MSNNDTECCICLNDIDEENIIKCNRCVNIICDTCFNKLDKKIDNNYMLCYTCPSCKLDIKLDLEDYETIKKYNLSQYFKNTLLIQTNNIMHLQIKNNILENKVHYLVYCLDNVYKIYKMVFIADKFCSLILIGIMYLFFS